MMKDQLCFSTLGCPSWDFQTILRQARDLGFAHLEIRGILNEMKSDRLPCFLPEHADETKALLKRYGLSIRVIGTSAGFHDPARTREACAEADKAIGLARRMGIPFIRVFGDKVPAGCERNDALERVIHGLRTVCDAAEQRGDVQALLEIHGDFNTAETVGPVLDKLGTHPAFGLIWDVEHSYRAYGPRFEPFYELIRPWIRHVHIKDCVMDGSRAIVRLPGEGGVNLPDILRRLRADGYRGCYSFEWEKRWHPEIPEPEKAFPMYVRYMRSHLTDHA